MPEAVLSLLGEVPGAAAYLSRARATCVPAQTDAAAAVRTVAVVGAGTMGRDIALALLLSGRDVVLSDPDPEALEAARDRIAAAAAKRGTAEEVLDHLQTVTGFDRIGGVQMVIEAVPERLDLKTLVLTAIAAVVSPETILATNTSTLDLDALANGVPGAERVIGTHFFMPAHVTQLLELVPAQVTAPRVIETARALAADLGKIPVIAGNCDGFIGNRLFDRLHQEAMYLVEEGAEPAQIDDALEGWGMKIGPLRALDMIGNDIPWGVRRQRAERDPLLEQPLVGDRLCEAGLMGQKTGRGWYDYAAGGRRGLPYDEGHEVALRAAADLGLVRREITTEETLDRCLAVLVLEAARIRAEGMASRAADIDLVFVTGYGFPPHMGGPLRLGAAVGAAQVRALADRLAQASRHKDRWEVPEALDEILDQVRDTEHAV